MNADANKDALRERIKAYLRDGVLSKEEEYAILLHGKDAGLGEKEIIELVEEIESQACGKKKHAYRMRLKYLARRFLSKSSKLNSEQLFVLREESERAGISTEELDQIVLSEKEKRPWWGSLVKNKYSLGIAMVVCIVTVWASIGGFSEKDHDSSHASGEFVAPSVAAPAPADIPDGKPEVFMYTYPNVKMTPRIIANELGGDGGEALIESLGFIKVMYLYLGIPIIRTSSSLAIESIIVDYEAPNAIDSFIKIMRDVDVGKLIQESCQASVGYPARDVFATRYSYYLQSIAALPVHEALSRYWRLLAALEKDVLDGRLPQTRNSMSDVLELMLFSRVLYIKAMADAFAQNYAVPNATGAMNYSVGPLISLLTPEYYLKNVQLSVDESVRGISENTSFNDLISSSGLWGSEQAKDTFKRVTDDERLPEFAKSAIVKFGKATGYDERMFSDMHELKAMMFVIFATSYFQRHEASISLIGHRGMSDKSPKVVDIHAYQQRIRLYFDLQSASGKAKELLISISRDSRLPERVANTMELGTFRKNYEIDLSALEKLYRVAAFDSFLIFDAIRTSAQLNSAQGWLNNDEEKMKSVGEEFARLVPISAAFEVTKSARDSWMKIQNVLKDGLGGDKSADYRELDTLSKTQPDWLQKVTPTK